MKKIIFSIFALSLIFMPIIGYSQNWTPEEKIILERVKTGWSSWQDAVNNKDLSIWLNAADPTDDWHCWWTQDGGLSSLNATERYFELFIKNVERYYWLNVNPIRIKVHDNVAFIWFYATYALEDKNGNTNTSEDKRFEVYRKVHQRDHK